MCLPWHSWAGPSWRATCLPVVPLVILIGVSTLWRRVRWWRGVVAIVALMFVAGWFSQSAVWICAGRQSGVPRLHPPSPARRRISGSALSHGASPHCVARQRRIDPPLPGLRDPPGAGGPNRTLYPGRTHGSGRSCGPDFEVALVFSTKYEPAHSLLENWRLWQAWKTRFFGYHRDVPPAAAAQILGGTLVYTETRNGQWIGVIEMAKSVTLAPDVRSCGSI